MRLLQARELCIRILACGLLTIVAAAERNAALGGGPRVDIVVVPGAPRLERFAAEELETILERLFEVDAATGAKPVEDSAARIFIGCPKSNPALAKAVDGDWPELSDQGIVLRRLKASKPTLVTGGGSPVATMWAAYELGERLGVRYLLDRDVFPPKQKWQGLPELNLVMEPNMRIRCWRLVNDLADGPVSWSLEENRRFLRQMAKMKYNRIHASLWPTQPFIHYRAYA